MATQIGDVAKRNAPSNRQKIPASIACMQELNSTGVAFFLPGNLRSLHYAISNATYASVRSAQIGRNFRPDSATNSSKARGS